MRNLSFEIENPGVTRNGAFTQKPLTLFCGANHGGKTRAMYSLYFSHRLMTYFAKETGPESRDISIFNSKLGNGLPDWFNTHAGMPDNAGFRIADRHKEEFPGLVMEAKDRTNFLMPAERNGLHLFYRELSTRRTALLHHASRENSVTAVNRYHHGNSLMIEDIQFMTSGLVRSAG